MNRGADDITAILTGSGPAPTQARAAEAAPTAPEAVEPRSDALDDAASDVAPSTVVASDVAASDDVPSDMTPTRRRAAPRTDTVPVGAALAEPSPPPVAPAPDYPPPPAIAVTGGDAPAGDGYAPAADGESTAVAEDGSAVAEDDEIPLEDVPEDIREAARNAPDHWLGMIDPGWDEDGIPPSWALVGEWRSDRHGEVVEWRPNEDYRPSPAMLDWPEPTDPVDAALQLAATGYGPVDELTLELSAANLLVLVQSDGAPVSASAPDGTPVVPVFSSSVYLEAVGPLASTAMGIAELTDRIPDGHMLYLNPSGPVPTVIDSDMLRSALEATTTEGGVPSSNGIRTESTPFDGTPFEHAPTESTPFEHAPTQSAPSPPPSKVTG